MFLALLVRGVPDPGDRLTRARHPTAPPALPALPALLARPARPGSPVPRGQPVPAELRRYASTRLPGRASRRRTGVTGPARRRNRRDR